jgi:hypothetical protein
MESEDMMWMAVNITHECGSGKQQCLTHSLREVLNRFQFFPDDPSRTLYFVILSLLVLFSLFVCLFLAGLGFELRASYLQSRYSTV